METEHKRPFLCNRLNVDVGEYFEIEGCDNVKFALTSEGCFTVIPSNTVGTSYFFLKAIENPALVKRF